MKIKGKSWRSIWIDEATSSVVVIDQTKLPYHFETKVLTNYKEVAYAIKAMIVRGAPLIGVAGAYGLMLALREDPSDEFLAVAFDELNSTRPTAVNLYRALKRVFDRVKSLNYVDRFNAARVEANLILEKELSICNEIGNHGLGLIKEIWESRNALKRNEPINILTHCNAGWLATVDWGTAIAPIYKAHRSGIDIHVWVDETRPRNQGAFLTAYELKEEGVPHTLIVDNAGGYLMQNGKVDLVIVGTDRVTNSGDVCNKIGTYLKALAAHHNAVPFFVATPSSSIDWSIKDGSQIPIETRLPKEITHINGLRVDSKNSKAEIVQIQLAPTGTKAFNPAFDVTPAKFITSFITEKGIVESSKAGLKKIFTNSFDG